MKRIGLLTVAGIPAMVLSLAAADQPAQEAQAKRATPMARPGLVVVVDSATHTVRPATPEEIAALAPKAARAAAAPPMMLRGASGSTISIVDRSLDSMAVVKKGADGKLQVECVQGPKTATAAVSSGARAVGASDEK